MKVALMVLIVAMTSGITCCEKQQSASGRRVAPDDAVVPDPFEDIEALNRSIQEEFQAARRLNQKLELSGFRGLLVGSTGFQATFVCVVVVDDSGRAVLKRTLHGRVHSDYSSYVISDGPGEYLVARVIPRNRGNWPDYEVSSYCFRISDTGEVVGLDPGESLNLGEVEALLGVRAAH